MVASVADPEIVGGGGCGRSRAAGLGGVPPHHREGVWGGGCAPSPEIFFNFDLKMTSFSALWVPVGGCIPLILPPGSATGQHDVDVGPVAPTSLNFKSYLSLDLRTIQPAVSGS